MEVQQSSFAVAFNILASALFALVSYLFNHPIRGHRLTIRHLSFSAAHHIRYQATVSNKTYSFTASSLTWHLHLPQPPNPRWCTITFHSIYYTSNTADVSTARIHTILHFFPVLFRQSAGPWADITLDDLRIRVFTSTHTPYWIQRLRQNLVGTLLAGDVLRADLFRTSVRFSGLTEREEDKPSANTHLSADDDSDAHEREADKDECVPTSDSDTLDAQVHEDPHDAAVLDPQLAPERSSTKALQPSDADELAFSVLAHQLHMHNTEGRIYSFGTVRSQIRRDWTTDRGSFAMVAEECRWVRVHFPFERVAARAWWTQLFSSFWHFPIDLVRTFNYPASSTNLHVTRLDVTFDSFRLRDAELLKQAFSLIHEKSIVNHVDWSDVFLDAVTHAVAPR